MIPIKTKPKLAELHYESIKNDLVHHIGRVLADNGIWKNRPRRHIGLSASLRNFLQQLEDLTNGSLQDLIVMSADDLFSYVDSLQVSHSNYIDQTHNDFKILTNIFVDSIYNSSKIFNKYSFVNEIDLHTCPYCNRNYIYSVNRRKIVKPEIDHFYPKTVYPMLAISYYNLIPSCEPCNGLGAKKQNDPYVHNLINPYLLTADMFKFTFKIKNVSIINPLLGKTDISVVFKHKIQSHCEVFNLDDLYSLHYDHAIELVIKKRLKYSKKYREYLRSFRGLKFSNVEVDRMILGNYTTENEQHKRPLSKLYQDIGKELGLITS